MMTYRIKRILNLIAVLCLLTGFGISSAQAAPSDHFVTTWKTDNPGRSNSTSITVPMVGGVYDVDWDNDGTFDEFWLTGPVTHDFGVAGTYTIRIQGIYNISFQGTGDKYKIVSLDQWGTQTWTIMNRAFEGCAYLEVPASDTPDFSAVTSMYRMFSSANSANPDTSGWDTSAVTNMADMFSPATVANPDTSGWDTSAVTDMSSMFASALAANPDTRFWNTSAVTDMSGMFAGANLANPDTSGWDTSAVTDMYGMFYVAYSANPDTSGWDTSAVTDMSNMFYMDRSANSANPDTSGWNTSAVTNMHHMFYRASSANPDTSGWNTSAVTDMSYMFDRAYSANPDTSGWNTSAVTDMSYMFSGATSANPDTGGWNTSAVTDMSYMFSEASSANPDTSGWDTSAVTNMAAQFYDIAGNPDTSGWNTSAVTNMSAMFFAATSANPDTSGWDTSAVLDMSQMFLGATSANPDASGWDVSSLRTASAMFSYTALSGPNYEALLINWNAQNLQPGVTFHGGDSTYCSSSAANARANMINSDGWAISDAGQDCAGPTPPPTAVTSSASSISASGARLNGSADPNGASTNAWFQWGTSTAYGNVTSPQTSVGSGTSAVSYYFNLSALQCGTTYYFRAAAQNSGGTAYGSGRSYTTSACSTPPPTAVTSSASSISASGARLNGSADPNGASTNAWFQWGTSTAYGNVTSPQTSVGSGTSSVSYYFNLGALACGTTYYFRAVAQNSGGTAYGSGRSFTTSACSTPPPTVVTSSANFIGQTAARLRGSADPNGASTNAWFQWGTSTAYGNVTSPQTSVGSGTSPVSYIFNLSALACGTTYHFRAVAQNSGGTAYGSGRSFTTSACSTPPPTVVTSSANFIGQTAARLRGSADPNGASTNAWFQWGTSTAYGNVTSPQTSVGSGTSPVSYIFNLSALACGTTYHFRAVAQNSGGTAYGSDRSFTTSACEGLTPPTAETSFASSITATAARLWGKANPNGASTNAWFQWGTTTTYGNATAPTTNVGSGTSLQSYGYVLGALQCGTTYHFRAVAQNSGGTAYGSDLSFNTSACDGPTTPPTLVTSPASSISATVARLNGTADPNGASTNAWFQWGTSTAYGNTTALNSVGSGTSPVSYSFNLSALACGTTYHFRAVAQNSGGTAYGSDRSFNTSACATPPPTAVTSPASSIGTTGARLNGTADPNGASTSAWFQWGTSTAYGNTTSQTNVGSGTSPVSYNFNLSTLACGTTYHVRAVAQNAGGTGYGTNRSFTTSACATPPPTAVTSPASSIGETAARLNGTADPNGASTSAWFQWGTSSSYGNTTAPQSNVGSGTSPVSYSFDLGALACGSTYHFRAVAQNAGGTGYGTNRSFTTSTCTDPGQEEVIMETRFETASKEGWSSKGKVSIDGVLAIDQYSLRHEKGAESVYSVMTTGYEDVSVTMHLAATSLRSGDACFAEVSTDGGDSWMPIVTVQNGEDSGAFYSGKEFPPGADNNLDVKLRFRASGKGNPGYCYGDEVYVMGTPIGG